MQYRNNVIIFFFKRVLGLKDGSKQGRVLKFVITYNK